MVFCGCAGFGTKTTSTCPPCVVLTTFNPPKPKAAAVLVTGAITGALTAVTAVVVVVAVFCCSVVAVDVVAVEATLSTAGLGVIVSVPFT